MRVLFTCFGAALVLGPEQIGAAAVGAALVRVVGEPGFVAAARQLRDDIAAMPSTDAALAALTAAWAGPTAGI